MFPVNGSLRMAPLFPRSGPGESGSPMSQVVLRCYDFPSRLAGHLFVSLPGSTLPSSVRVSQLALALPAGRRVPSGPGSLFSRDPIPGLLSRGRERDLPGFQAVHPVPLPRSRTPAESTFPRLFVGLVDAAPASRTAKASACQLFRGYSAASTPAAYASRVMLPPPLQSSLPVGWLASTGRESNPLDRFERFQITFSFPFPGLNLALPR